MSFEDELEVLIDLRRIHRRWAAGVGRAGLSAAANRSEYLDAWADPDWTEATPDQVEAFGARAKQLEDTLVELLTLARFGNSPPRPNEHHDFGGHHRYSPSPEVAERNQARRIKDLRFFISPYGKVAEALFLQHELSHQFFFRGDKQWVRLPEGLAHAIKRSGLVEVTVDAVAVWDAHSLGGYAYLGEFAGLRMHADDGTRRF